MSDLLDPNEVPDSPWSKAVPNLQIAWDSTSFRWAQECPRKYQLSMILSKTSKKFKAPLTFGILMHKALEVAHRAMAEGKEFEEAVSLAVDFSLREGKDLDHPDNLEKERSRFGLVRAVVWYLDHFYRDTTRTMILDNGKPAVELAFRFTLPLDSPDGVPYLWCGHIDRIVMVDDRPAINDYKTTKYSIGENFFKQFSMSNQMTGYILAGQILLHHEKPLREVLIDGIELKVNFNRFLRGATERTPEQLEEWIQHTIAWIKQFERYAEESFWPMNRESCDKYGGCPFREVCSKGPSTREEWLQAEYEDKVWNPLENREP